MAQRPVTVPAPRARQHARCSCTVHRARQHVRHILTPTSAGAQQPAMIWPPHALEALSEPAQAAGAPLPPPGPAAVLAKTRAAPAPPRGGPRTHPRDASA
eukprot:2749449-Lingulodinium_polyedra.AAC.1